MNLMRSKSMNHNELIVEEVKLSAKKLISKYFEDSSIQGILHSLQMKLNPYEIQNLLQKYSACLSESANLEETKFTEMMNFILDEKLKITFYELESSKIVPSLCKYLDSSFYTNYSKFTTRNLIQKPSHLFFDRLKNFIKYLRTSSKDCNGFIKMLQYCITSMNCFQVNLSKENYYKPVVSKIVSSI